MSLFLMCLFNIYLKKILNRIKIIYLFRNQVQSQLRSFTTFLAWSASFVKTTLPPTSWDKPYQAFILLLLNPSIPYSIIKSF